MKYPVISLWQPWASWVIAGWKTIETRTHNRFHVLRGQTVLIHASKTWDAKAARLAWNYLTPDQYTMTKELKVPGHATTPLGAILGSVRIVNFRGLGPDDSQAALIDCGGEPHLFGLVCADPRPLRQPLQFTGSLGIWYADVEEELFQ